MHESRLKTLKGGVMNYRRFKKTIVSLTLMCVFAFPVATTFTPPVYAQSGVYSDVAKWTPDRLQGTPLIYTQGTSPGQYPGPVMPAGYHPPYPHTHYQGVSPSYYPGPLMPAGYHPPYPHTHYQGASPSYHYPGPVMPAGYHPPYPHTHYLY